MIKNSRKYRLFLIITILIGLFVIGFRYTCVNFFCFSGDEIMPLNIQINDKNILGTGGVIANQEENPKRMFNNECMKIDSNQDILDLINKQNYKINEELKKSIELYVQGKILRTEIENQILLAISQTDNSNSILERLNLNFLFLKINDIDRGNQTNCEDIFVQYYK